VVTEQSPTKLGATVAELRDVLPASSPVFAKTLFSMVTPEVEAFLTQNAAIKQVMLLGIEGHVCVTQTSLDLLERGYEVHILADGTSSQRLTDREAGLMRMAQSGAFICTSEMALFQLQRDASAAPFKEISALVREQRPDMLPGLSARGF